MLKDWTIDNDEYDEERHLLRASQKINWNFILNKWTEMHTQLCEYVKNTEKCCGMLYAPYEQN